MAFKSKIILAALPLAAIASPLAAQTSAPATAPAAITPTPSPSADRIAAAKPVIDKLWPLGTYRKMMGSQMSEMVSTMMESMYDMKGEDLVPGGDIPEADKGKTMGELAESKDPHFRERMRIMMDVMFKEMTPLLDKAEPSVRGALTTIYARKFTAAQLSELDRFLGTPTGKVYSENWVSSFYSPELMSAMKDFAPEMIKAMPAIMDKFEKATAHLPPPATPSNPDDLAAVAAADAAAAAADAEDAATDADPTLKWSEADRKLGEQLSNEALKLSDQYDTAEARYQLHALDAKERSGQKLEEHEIEQREYLRDVVKGQ